MNNIFDLHHDLINHTYRHGGYQQFKINDPKPRIIHKASVRDRLLHHVVYRKLYPFFDKKFISESYSCRNNKGTHKALSQFKKYARIVSKNNTKQCRVLKCDIEKFFAIVDQQTPIKILKEYIPDKDVIDLLKEIIYSFKPNGLPLGNLTSQLFANICMNEFDQFAKHKLKAKYYIRYSDDFVILSGNKNCLENIIPEIKYFLEYNLKLTLHPDKISIRTICSGQDFLGWVNFEDNMVLRRTTKRKIFKRVSSKNLQSYLSVLSHGNELKTRKQVIDILMNKV
ncbi:MAG: reverse transcriptase/maturase family protein [bacterium]|nr:reverse transcriptase/maturase family protein [bacterium]